MKKQEEKEICNDKRCPFHGELSVRGRHFLGYVKKIVGTRAVIVWETFVYFPKYERYERRRSKIHAHIPSCLRNEIKANDHVEAGECRPLSKITNFVVLKKVEK